MKLINFLLSKRDICSNHAGLVAFLKTAGAGFIFGSKIDSKIT